jgi:hypothetical protein
LAAGDYQLVVVNFGNHTSENDFTVSTYAEKVVEIQEEKNALESAITRAEKSNPNDVIVSKIHNQTFD